MIINENDAYVLYLQKKDHISSWVSGFIAEWMCHHPKVCIPDLHGPIFQKRKHVSYPLHTGEGLQVYGMLKTKNFFGFRKKKIFLELSFSFLSDYKTGHHNNTIAIACHEKGIDQILHNCICQLISKHEIKSVKIIRVGYAIEETSSVETPD